MPKIPKVLKAIDEVERQINVLRERIHYCKKDNREEKQRLNSKIANQDAGIKYLKSLVKEERGKVSSLEKQVAILTSKLAKYDEKYNVAPTCLGCPNDHEGIEEDYTCTCSEADDFFPIKPSKPSIPKKRSKLPILGSDDD